MLNTTRQQNFLRLLLWHSNFRNLVNLLKNIFWHCISVKTLIKAVPVQNVCVRRLLPMWAVMFVCLCACPLDCLSSVRVANANANVLVWDGLNLWFWYLQLHHLFFPLSNVLRLSVTSAKMAQDCFNFAQFVLLQCLMARIGLTIQSKG